MKKVYYLLLIVAILLILPLGVNAKSKSKINIYFFRGEGCPHCQEAEEFFDKIKSEYGKYYNIVDYETWYNTDNADLMKKVADKLGEEASGVPYIIIGKKSWNGYSSEYDDEIIAAIKSEYNKSNSERYDVIKKLNSKSSENITADIISIILILLVGGGIVFGIIMARKNTN